MRRDLISALFIGVFFFQVSSGSSIRQHKLHQTYDGQGCLRVEAKPNIGYTITYSDAYCHLVLVTLSPPADNLVRSTKSLRFFEPVSKLSITVESNLKVISVKHELSKNGGLVR